MKITPVMLAKDVLKWLANPAKECPITPKLSNGYVIVKGAKAKEVDVQKHVKSGKKCEVCGLGGLAVALATRIDSLKATGGFDYGGGGFYSAEVEYQETISFLQPYFTESQLNQIEDAFEDGEGLPRGVESARARLKAICESIVANKGKFVQSYY